MALGRDSDGQLVQAFEPGQAQSVTIGAASADSAPLLTGTRFVRLCATVNCRIAFNGDDATANHMLLPAGSPEYFAVRGGTTIAVTQVSEAGSLSIMECD
jgi:hypothetical protein